MDQQTYEKEYEKERQRMGGVNGEAVTANMTPSERREVAEAAVGGSSVGALTGAGAAVLAIIGLAGALPFYMTTIATIAIGAGLFAEGTSLGVGLGRIDRNGIREEDAAAGGFALQGLAGAAGIVLGILALIGLLPTVLIAIAILTMGGALVFGGPARAELNLTALQVSGGSITQKRVATQAVNTSAGLLTLVGLGAVTLAILALVGAPYTATLVLVSLLGLGGALLLSDSLLLGRAGGTMSYLRHRRPVGRA